MELIRPRMSARSLALLDKYNLKVEGRQLVPAGVRRKFEHGDSIAMLQGSRKYTFDANMQLSDGGQAYAAAGWATVGGAQAIVDLGGNQGTTISLPSISNVSSLTPQQPRFDGVVVIYVSASTISGSDVYKVILGGSNNAGLTTGNVILGMLEFGKGSAMDLPNCADQTAPLGSGNYPAGEIYEMLFTNEQYGTPYEFVSMYTAGTFGSITYSAYIAPLPRI